MVKQVCSFNPLPSYLQDAAILIVGGLDKSKPDSGSYFFTNGRAAAMESVAALHSFANNLIQIFDGQTHGILSVKFERILDSRGQPSLSDSEGVLLREIEEVEALICNPHIATPFAIQAACPVPEEADSLGFGINFERTNVFDIPKNAQVVSCLDAAVCLGLVFILINHYVTVRLELSESDIIKVFGVSVRSIDGFTDTYDVLHLKHMFLHLTKLKSVLDIQMLRHKGVITKETYSLTFLEKHCS
jgi:hypothetical protein